MGEYIFGIQLFYETISEIMNHKIHRSKINMKFDLMLMTRKIRSHKSSLYCKIELKLLCHFKWSILAGFKYFISYSSWIEYLFKIRKLLFFSFENVLCVIHRSSLFVHSIYTVSLIRNLVNTIKLRHFFIIQTLLFIFQTTKTEQVSYFYNNLLLLKRVVKININPTKRVFTLFL